MQARSRLLSIALGVAVVIGVAALVIRLADWRPPTAHDFRQLKTAYIDLYNLNSQRFELAGNPKFPIITDSRRPADGHAVAKLGDLMFREMLYSLAYSPDSEPPRQGRQPLIAHRSYSSAMLAHAREVLIVNQGRSQIEGVGLAPISADVRVPPEGPMPPGPDPRRIARTLFDRFLTEKKNGPNPLGSDFNIRFVDMVEIYGYGQCHSLSYALARMLARHGLKASLVNTGPVLHTFVEADLGNVKGLLDPLLGIALIDSTGARSYDRDYVLTRASSIEPTLPETVRGEFQRYYRNATVVDVEPVSYRKSEDRVRTFALGPGDSAQYIFERIYPWITTRNLEFPPEGAVGFLRISRELEAADFRDRGEWSVAVIETPYPIVDLEILQPTTGTLPELAVLRGNVAERIHINGHTSLIRLARYLKGDGQQYSVMLGVKRTNATHIRVRAISQFALPRFQASTTERFEITGNAPDSLIAYVDR